jgi:hypothetical protein
VVLNDGTGTAPMTEALKALLMQRVTAYGSNHALRCLALARRSMPPSSQQVRPQCHLHPLPNVLCARDGPPWRNCLLHALPAKS